MIVTTDSLLPMPKLDCDGCYDVAVKILSVVVLFQVSLATSIVPSRGASWGSRVAAVTK
jgi:hypothetical protein